MATKGKNVNVEISYLVIVHTIFNVFLIVFQRKKVKKISNSEIIF
jgi:hypothetical protein